MDRCENCKRPALPLCSFHHVCFECHDWAMIDMAQEIEYARYRVPVKEQQTEALPKQRTLGSRIVGSMWTPGDPADTDDIEATCGSILHFLEGGTQR